MAKKIKAYIDTSAFIAFLDHSDTYHHTFKNLFAEPPLLVTTSLVISEGHAWFLKRYDSNRAIEFLCFIDELPYLTIYSVGKTEIEKSTRFIKKYSDQQLTMVDALGLYVMESQKIRSCWSTDRHLNLTGVPLVIYSY